MALGGDVLVSGEFGAVEGDEVLLRQRSAICCGMPSKPARARRSRQRLRFGRKSIRHRNCPGSS
jgi:hypothetical protein